MAMIIAHDSSLNIHANKLYFDNHCNFEPICDSLCISAKTDQELINESKFVNKKLSYELTDHLSISNVDLFISPIFITVVSMVDTA